MHYKIARNIFDLYPLFASSNTSHPLPPFLTTKSISKYCSLWVGEWRKRKSSPLKGITILKQTVSMHCGKIICLDHKLFGIPQILFLKVVLR